MLWRVWAPKAKRVELVLLCPDGPQTAYEMQAEGEEAAGGEGAGYFSLKRENIPEGQRYGYRLDGGELRPDPCSLWQPQGVLVGGAPGPSAVVRTERFRWTDAGWAGVRREEIVFYELHIGTFTPEGTFDAAIARLPQLRELGVTVLEIMPVNQFPGGRNWGYDGVSLYAAQNTYGGPQGLARLIDAAHRQGLAVVLDVVYNHFGPEGSFIGEFGPYFTDNYRTPWGPAVNYDGRGSDAVRDFVLDNARMWLGEFHADGLRLDAVHAIYDLGARHLLKAIKEVADEVAAETGVPRHIIGESDLNDPRILLDPARGGHGLDAQWADDFHHAAHALLSGETRGYYADYGALHQLAATLNNPYLFNWSYSGVRGRKHGSPLPPDLGGDRFVVCIQNHDQVGNRAVGDRIDWLLRSPAQRRLAAGLLLLSPYLPLIFMGEEYGERRPFPFFCNFCGEQLIQAVREGRKSEFKDFLGDAEHIPLPDAQETFDSAKLTWAWPEGTEHAGLRRLYQDLLRARRSWPALKDLHRRHARLLPDPKSGPIMELTRGATAQRATGTASTGTATAGTATSSVITAYFNFSDTPQPLPVSAPGNLLLSSEDPKYTGARPHPWDGKLLPWEIAVLER